MSNSRGDMTLGDKSVSVPGQNRHPDKSRKVPIIVDPGEGWRADCGIDTSRITITTEEVNLQYAAQNIPTVVRDYFFSSISPIFSGMFSAKPGTRRTSLPPLSFSWCNLASYSIVYESTGSSGLVSKAESTAQQLQLGVLETWKSMYSSHIVCKL